jgi:hypothetical protein
LSAGHTRQKGTKCGLFWLLAFVLAFFQSAPADTSEYKLVQISISDGTLPDYYYPRLKGFFDEAIDTLLNQPRIPQLLPASKLKDLKLFGVIEPIEKGRCLHSYVMAEIEKQIQKGCPSGDNPGDFSSVMISIFLSDNSVTNSALPYGLAQLKEKGVENVSQHIVEYSESTSGLEKRDLSRAFFKLAFLNWYWAQITPRDIPDNQILYILYPIVRAELGRECQKTSDVTRANCEELRQDILKRLGDLEKRLTK